MKKFNTLITAIFCLFVGGMLVVSTILPDRNFSPLENRYLAKPPKLSLETLDSGTFMEDAEEYVSDQIVGRDFWVALKAWSERLSGKQENNGVYFGKEDTLLNRVNTPSQEELDKRLGYVDALVGNVSVPVYLGLIPSSSAVWSDRLPTGAPTADELKLIEDFYFNTGAQTLDMAGALLEHKDEDIYTSGVRWVTPDSIDTYISGDGVKVTSWFTGQPQEGSLYVERYLNEKDKYSYFLGGNQSLCVLETEHTDAPKVLVIRDSYSDSLAPFLTERFSQVHLFDPRNNLSSVKEYVADNGIDTVLVLYSFSNFATDQYLFVLGR